MLSSVALWNQYGYSTHAILSVASGFFDLSVGLIVLLQNRRSDVNRALFFVTITAFLWVFGFGMMAASQQDTTSYRWAAFAYIGIPLISPSVYIFSRRWRGLPRTKIEVTAVLTGAALAVFFSLLPDKLFSFVDHPWGRFVLVRPGLPARAAYGTLIFLFSFFAALAMHSFFCGWREAKVPVQKIQFRNVLFAFVIAYVGSIDFAVKLGANFYPSGCAWLSGLILVIAYTVLRHRAFEIDLVIQRLWLIALIYSALLSLSLPAVSVLLHNRAEIGDIPLIAALSGIGAALLSGGPATYAYLVGQSFWFKRHATSGLTHELKSPLSAIQSATDLIHDSLGRGDLAQTYEYLRMIDRNSTRLEKNVQQLLTLIRIQDGALRANRQALHLNQLIQEGVSHYESLAAEKGIRFRLVLDRDDVVEADATGLSQILSNVISNSVKFSSGGLIGVTTAKDGAAIRIEVADSGIGIDRQHIGRIFDRFFQTDPTNPGSGLGLAIARGWVEAHGGKIWAASDGIGKGAKFFIVIPSAIRFGTR